jgi:hypothetical protein
MTDSRVRTTGLFRTITAGGLAFVALGVGVQSGACTEGDVSLGTEGSQSALSPPPGDAGTLSSSDSASPSGATDGSSISDAGGANEGSSPDSSSDSGRCAATPLFGTYTLLSHNGAAVTDPNLQPAQIVASSGLASPNDWTTSPAVPVIGQFDVQSQEVSVATPGAPPYSFFSLFNGPLQIGASSLGTAGSAEGSFDASYTSFMYNLTLNPGGVPGDGRE